ncbi:Type III restriction enzyme, res subunit [Crenothrix polyspora]|uniref:Type III restriction enzyme, res subunit n=1 Tax=Crenothrix polyspora TaxID=360316 RepID=A0A1R4HBF3_9GAMM|nr:DEAD/DEAH box helicase family protein [Crenothrix polyspora]SJM93553.1 Type III restriction enzyme, res subunit [Crenothrix polyspora]
MRYFEPKDYQRQVLDSIEKYFKAYHEQQNPSLAFYSMTGVAYLPLKGFAEDMPYFCLRVPTGGGKTWLAATSVDLINKELLRTEHSVILWLVPSNQIKEQTLQGLKNREHPLYTALSAAGAITVLSLDEAKSVTPSTLNTSTTVIVATRQAFQVENEENRKVYESNGALMAHFDTISHAQRGDLLKDGDTVPYSLANVLRLRRPFIIVDEAHNNRTDLGFDTLAKFNPSGIMELTATPDLVKTPSNVLHSVSAVELKLEEMIKLPIRLEIQPNWQQCLADAIACREGLQAAADKEYRQGNHYLRPIVLIQAEAKRTGVATLDTATVKQELITNHNIPDHEIVIATGEEKGLTALTADYPLGIMDKKCPVKFVITQKALAEGWDCSFAYILVSMANLHSSTAVEQLLGRILRQPNATHRDTPELNQSYAFVVSRNFQETASALRDSLVNGAGFDRKAVTEFVKPRNPEQLDLDQFKDRKIPPIDVPLDEKPILTNLPKHLKEKITWNNATKVLTVTAPLTIEDAETLKTAVQETATKTIIDKVAEDSRKVAIEHFQTPVERGESLRVPQLAVYVQGELQLFDDPKMLDYPWDISRFEVKPPESDVSKIRVLLNSADGGTLDISNAEGKVTIAFMNVLQRSLELVYQPEHWDTVKLATWLCRNIPEPTITHTSKQAFVMGWLQSLLESFSLAEINQQKFLIRHQIEQHINKLRDESISAAYQSTLFESDSVSVDGTYVFEFPAFYSPTRYYDTHKYGHSSFENHLYGQIGDFDSKEEFECACHLERLAAKKKIKFWVRNLTRGASAFFLQKANGRFYPDFVCKLPDESILVVEYKGGDRWKEAEDDRNIGGLWANLSHGKCRFVMTTEKRWETIDAVIEAACQSANS